MKTMLFLIFSMYLINTYSQTLLVDFVNPFTGTQNMGHTFPGATVPFGMVQLSPDTDTVLFYENEKYNKNVYRYCAGYQYSDPTIVGFSHTHFNGTGHSDLGDFLIMPFVGTPKLNPGTANQPDKGYRSRFSHDNELAEPGYYSVYLKDPKVKAELTATTRVGIHQYTYETHEKRKILLDLFHGIYNYEGKTIWSSIEVINDTLVVGYRQTQGWARNRKLFFALVFSEKITNYKLINQQLEQYNGFWRKFSQTEKVPEISGKKLKAWFEFQPVSEASTPPTQHNKRKKTLSETKKPLKIKLALSAVSKQGAIQNLQKEAPHWNFTKYRENATNQWEKELSKIEIEAEQNILENFYTGMYHAFMHPIEYQDVNGQYRGLDQNIYQAKNVTNYTIFSLWDTFRALHPLFTITQPQRTSDMVNSMLAHQEQSPFGMLPIWSHYNNDNWCMTGYHATSVIADAIAKNIEGINTEKAVEAMKSTLFYSEYDQNTYYTTNGYMPHDKTPNAASKTLEICYNDWAAYITAKQTKNEKLTRKLRERSANYKNIFDYKTGFMRSKMYNKSWYEPFDPLSTHGQGYIEGNAYTYTLFVPHDIAGLAHIMGGDQKLINHLDTLFAMKLPAKNYAHNEDIEANGIIGNYIHGNEPGHHVPYMYNYVGKPWKTQKIVREINRKMYKATPNGLCGNDDCGQMSAWYIFTALGFYPVTPGTNQYVLGSPNIKRAKINLNNGKTFKIEVKNQSPENIYVQKVYVNEKYWPKLFITHRMITEGGKITFEMGNKPNKKRGTTHSDRPYSLSNEH